MRYARSIQHGVKVPLCARVSAISCRTIKRAEATSKSGPALRPTRPRYRKAALGQDHDDSKRPAQSAYQRISTDRSHEGNQPEIEQQNVQHVDHYALRRFYPAVFFVETPSLLLCLFTRHIGEQVAHQGLFGMETPQIVLRTLYHQVQAHQGVSESLLQGL